MGMWQKQSLASVSSCVSITQLCISGSTTTSEVCLPTAMQLGWQGCWAADYGLYTPCRSVLWSPIKNQIRFSKLGCNSIIKQYRGACQWRSCSAAVTSEDKDHKWDKKGLTGWLWPICSSSKPSKVKQLETKQLMGRNVLIVQRLHVGFFSWAPILALLNIRNSSSTKLCSVGYH